MIRNRATGRWVARNEQWLTIVVSSLSAIAFSIYTGFYTAAPSETASGRPISVFERVRELGPANNLAVLGIVLMGVQVVLILVRSSVAKLQERTQGELLTDLVLDSVVRLLRLRKRRVIYRALVTIDDVDPPTRTTVCGANIRTDPELTLTVPREFGVAGQAFKLGAMQCGDLDDVSRVAAPDGSEVEGIWKDIKCVLAYPMLTSSGRSFGTVNFDSDHTLVESDLGKREVQDILGCVAELCTTLLKGLSPDGTVRTSK